MKKTKKGFTLVELLAVIAILAIILLIAVPTILGIIDGAKKDSFRNSVRSIIKAVELKNAKDGNTTGNIAELDLSNKDFTGTWKIENGTITLTKVCNKEYCAKDDVTSINYGNNFEVVNAGSVTPSVVYKETLLNGAIPELHEGLIPVMHDGTKWVVADTKTQWYKYADKKWANAVTVTSSSRDKYKVAGTGVLEADVLTCLVWIPRYKYKLWNVNNESSNEQTIELTFEDKNTIKSNGTTNGTYLTHPSFTFGTTELNGIWVGKFENSTSDTTCNTTPDAANCNKELPILVKPNVASLRYQTVSTMFKEMRTMENSGNQYGINGSIVDTHMMKNMEWGAVSYLSHSNYGINGEIRINNSNTYTTGCAASTASGAAFAGCENAYNTATGNLASTTGNITGIYDMSGGAYEYVMGNMYNSDTNTNLSIASSGFTQAEIDGLGKYIDKYTYGTTYNDATAHARCLIGDATKETLKTFGGGSMSSWYGDYSSAVGPSNPFVDRGGRYNNGANAGAFSWSSSGGNASSSISSRLVIAKA